MKASEKTLTDKAKQYLKDVYGEDTVWMTVMENDVEDGNEILAVECTVLIAGEKSDWFKEFTFKNGQVTNMTCQVVQAVEEVRRKETCQDAVAREQLERTSWFWRKNLARWTAGEQERWMQLNLVSLGAGGG